MFHCLLYFSYFFHWFLYTIFHYLSLLFIVFQLFNLILWSLIRLKNMKTDKIEYFRDPGVTWLQIIYLEAFHCVDFFLYVSLFLLYFSFFSLVFTIFHYLSLLFIVFQLFHLILWSLIRLKNMKTDKIEYFRDPGVTLLQIIYIYIYTFGSLPLRGFFFRMFHCFCCIFHIPGVSDNTNNFCYVNPKIFRLVSTTFCVKTANWGCEVRPRGGPATAVNCG